MSRDALDRRYAGNELKGTPGVNLALGVVLVLSAFLATTGAMVMERLIGSVDQLFEEARPPHFLQMHKGDYDPAALSRFAAEHPEIEAWLVVEMLGFDGAAIGWHRATTGESGDLSASLIDNLVVTQNEQFDFLIDETGAIPSPGPGEVYVPVAYQQSVGLEVGDELSISTDAGSHELIVQGFVRDSQMASSLSSATRFLVSEPDLLALERAGGGAPENIVEYRLTDPAGTADLQRAYEADETVPKNGQAVTLGMIRMIHAFGDGLVAVALVFVSLLLVAIALLNLRFVIRGTLEDEVREIGVMKAIGLPDRTIAGLYIAKYRVITLLACLVGGVLAVVATGVLTRPLELNYAAAPTGAMTILVPVVVLALVYLLVITCCRRALGRVRKVEVVTALVHGSTHDERRSARRAARQARRVRRSRLAPSRGGSITRRLALVDLRADGGQWALIPVVFFLAAVLMILPTNLLSTFESPRFITYMGAPESDLRADLQFSDDVDAVRDSLLAGAHRDTRLTDVRAFADVLYETPGEDGWQTLRVEVGDYSSHAVEILQGERPGPGEIALSVLNADRYELSTGDEMTLRRDGEPTTVVVSGIYQDVTSGGYTAKMPGEVTAGAAGYVVYADTRDGADPAAVAAEYSEQFPTAAVIPVREYVRQTLSTVTGAFRSAAVLAVVLGVGVAGLITSLFLRLRLTRERQTMGTLSTIGFSAREIVSQVRLKTLLSVAVGTGLGVVFAATAGETVVGLLISVAGLGIADLAFIPTPLLVYVTYPLLLLATGYLAAMLLTAPLRNADKSSWLNR
ncbi:FtsX-like permease family protein [Georgenia sp. MJ170]|uniref:FtsX-like permease family protein n=1 Tax=Georgenia sunbinii TaxID=3117728 RepID=UPI002F265685